MITDLALALLLAPTPVRLAIAAPGIAAWVAWQAIKRGWWGATS